MDPIFRPEANVFARIALGIVLLGIVLAGALGFWLARSAYSSGVGRTPEQPVPFSHKHHVGDIGLDCRFCHTSVEQSAFAGLPPTETCMGCHSELWTQAPMLAPVRESWRTGKPLRWIRVNDLPDYVYFNHGVHVGHGVGCTVCHGPVDELPLMAQAQTLYMAWCLECHREPERFLRPREAVFDPDWRPPENRISGGLELVRKYHVRVGQITDCYTCHR